MTKRPSSTAAAEARNDGALIRHALMIAGIVVAALLIWKLNHILLLLFGAILIALLLRTVAEPFEKYAKLPPRLAVLAALVTVLGLMALGGWAFGRQISGQLSSLADQLPTAWDAARTQLSRLPFGAELTGRLDEALADMGLTSPAAGDVPGPPSGTGSMIDGGMFASVGAFAGAVASALVELLLVIFAGLFLALNPQGYEAGVVKLFDRRSHRAAAVVGRSFDVAGKGLRLWLLGQLVAMTAVGVVTGLGAWAIGLPSPLALGVIAGVLEFVPIAGPVLATIPALLLAATMGPEMILWTLALYVGIQQIEGNLIMPMAQRQTVALPPVITLFAILIFAALFGPLGVLLATPLAVVLFAVVKGVYLDEPISGPGG